MAQIEQGHAVALVPVEQRDHQEPTVLGDPSCRHTRGMIGDRENQSIALLRLAEPVEVDRRAARVISLAIGQRGVAAVVDA